jgi:glycosyltransferase involved in cell wall biosynthesis
MKTVLIDTYKTKDLYSGLGQFSLNFANQLIIQKPQNLKLSFLIPKAIDHKIIQGETGIQFIKAGFQKRYFPFLNTKYTIWHSLHQFPAHFPNRGTALILTIHDLNFLQEKSERKSAHYLKLLQRNINKADYITTISNYSKNLIENNLNLKGKKIQVIYNGIAPNLSVQSTKPSFADNEKFFFSIGIFNRKKNFHTLLPMMKHFKDHKLVLAGNVDTAYGKEVLGEISRLNLENKVILPGKISESDKYWLYNNCEAFLFPSCAEGFGMPVIEAMKAGKPVFLSNYTSLPEIGGEKAFYFDTFDEFDMSNLIKKSLNVYNQDRAFHEQEMKKYAEVFSWDTCIKEYLKIYDLI